MSTNCLIVDDEPLAQNILMRYLEQVKGFEVIGKCLDAVEAVNMLKTNRVDLIFLDIEMPKLDGLSFLKTLSSPPKVIITTAYREYALEGFELDVVDYLLKPISFDRFLKAINKISRRLDVENETHLPKEADYIYLRADNKMIQVPFSEIKYIQSLSNYVQIFREGKSIISYQKLSHLQKVLPSSKFLRVHRSYIIPVERITAYTSSYIEIEDQEIPLGGKYRDRVIDFLKKFEG
ncbi:MAG: response regulator transcription factor [Chloroflexota bacterium]|nr:response regulator transcription factor [Chloroflexota bacterium]